MPRKSRKRQPVNIDHFLRSINVVYDANEPDRVRHFRPTSKCVNLISALLGQNSDRSYLVVAPYGTGKSLTATYLLQLIENRSEAKSALGDVAKRLEAVNPELGRFAANRRRSKKQRGIVIALHGYCPSLAESLKNSALESMSRLKLGREARAIQTMPCETIEDGIAILQVVNEKCLQAGGDRVAIVWDEFGRHLESLIGEGRGDLLGEVQLLAEFVSRSKEIPNTLALMLHQGLLNYATNAPQSVRNEWTKIEGRFSTIQYVDDSKEIYQLIADVISELAPPKRGITKKKLRSVAKECQRLGLFSSFSLEELTELLSRSFPLEPVTLYLLPRVSARVAQNERTLFSFLHSQDYSERVTPADLYDYFSGAMRSDTAVGGTHRQWLETESAVSKVPDDEDAHITLKSACLLGLGTSGERTRTSLELLKFTLKGYQSNNASGVDELIERKLILHRRHNDEVSVWHGTDLDLRGRLEEERRRHVDQFDLVKFLQEEAAPVPWKPVQYNDEYCIRRYFEAEYQTVSRLQSYVSWDVIIEDLPLDCDGKIVYLIAESQEELDKATEIASEQLSHPRLVIVIPREPLPLADAAIEVTSLNRMQLDSELLESDPLALEEIHQMLDDSQSHLHKLIDRLIQPEPDGSRWFYQGSELEVDSPSRLRHELSEIMREVYPLSPRINNEVVVRKKPTPIMVNARKKLLLGILERHGQPELGIEGNFPDKSLFRTVLLHTGLYRQDRNGLYGYAAPTKRSNLEPGVLEVWQKFHEFLTVPADRPKPFQRFFEELMAPPYGLRAGVIPILLAAALKAFPSAVSLTRDGEYVVDILPSEIEQVCKEPNKYRLLVLDVDEDKQKYLRALHKKFSAVNSYEADENDLVRLCFDAIEAWKTQLPPAALSTKRLSDRAMRFRNAVLNIDDPVQLLFERFPDICGKPVDKPKALTKTISACMEELTSVAGLYAEQATASLCHAVGLRFSGSIDDVRSEARRWSECFSDSFIEKLTDGVAKGLLSRLRMPYDSDELLINSLGSLLVGKPLSRWDDSTVSVFDRELHSVVHRIEDAALSYDEMNDSLHAVSDGIKKLVRSRIETLYLQLEKMVGSEEAREVLESVANQQHKERV